mgnify:CR=1 FL=1
MLNNLLLRQEMQSTKSYLGPTVIGRIASYMPLVLPYHFMAMQFVSTEYRKMKKEDEDKSERTSEWVSERVSERVN